MIDHPIRRRLQVEVRQLSEMTDAFGNTIDLRDNASINPGAKKLSRKEAKQKARHKKLRQKRGEKVTDSESDSDW